MEYKVGIINAGAWGTAIARQIAEKGIAVQMWDFMDNVVDDINNNHRNSRYLPDVLLPETLTASGDITEVASGKEFLIIATPSLFLINTVKQLITSPEIREGKTIIGIITKGFIPSPSGPRFIVDSIEDYLPGFYRDNVVYIAGPSHAEEVARNKAYRTDQCMQKRKKFNKNKRTSFQQLPCCFFVNRCNRGPDLCCH